MGGATIPLRQPQAADSSLRGFIFNYVFKLNHGFGDGARAKYVCKALGSIPDTKKKKKKENRNLNL